jgi:hypothetical protein
LLNATSANYRARRAAPPLRETTLSGASTAASRQLAVAVRRDVLGMTAAAKASHVGSCLSVTDILAVATALRARPEFKGRRLVLAAHGELTVPAQVAAALDTAIDGVYLAEGLVSFRSVVETENYRASFANFVSGLLLHTDLPDITASISPRRVVIAGAVDAAGKAAEVSGLQRLYPEAHVVAEPRWDLEVLNQQSFTSAS